MSMSRELGSLACRSLMLGRKRPGGAPPEAGGRVCRGLQDLQAQRNMTSARALGRAGPGSSRTAGSGTPLAVAACSAVPGSATTAASQVGPAPSASAPACSDRQQLHAICIQAARTRNVECSGVALLSQTGCSWRDFPCPRSFQCVLCVWAAHKPCQACPGKCASPAAGLLASYEDLPEAQQAALLASALPSMPRAWRAEVARQTGAGAQAPAAFGAVVACARFHGPRTALVGDAAHAVTSTLGQARRLPPSR